MTLINFLTRVHFADGVLEEALRSEIEANGKRRPLAIADRNCNSKMLSERLYAGFPVKAEPVLYSDVPHQPTEVAAREIASLYRDHDCDLLVAFGSSRVIDLAKTARVVIAHKESLGALSVEEGGSRRISDEMPELYAIPGILGFASAISDYARVTLKGGRQVLLSSPNLIPRIAICDPTLTLETPAHETAYAAAGVLSRGIDSYLSPRYNPPADGLALDALQRIFGNVDAAIQFDDLNARREMMASGLNSSLSLQKGLCVIHAICNAICAASKSKPDPSAVGGAVIAHLVTFYEQELNGRCDPIKRALRLDERRSLADGLTELLDRWPTSRSLGALGVEVSELSAAADIAAADRAISNGPRPISRGEIREMLTRAH
ncbi:MAG: iron-containing alcohol dehydrogenase [Pseudomonadota bacterium]